MVDTLLDVLLSSFYSLNDVVRLLVISKLASACRFVATRVDFSRFPPQFRITFSLWLLQQPRQSAMPSLEYMTELVANQLLQLPPWKRRLSQFDQSTIAGRQYSWSLLLMKQLVVMKTASVVFGPHLILCVNRRVRLKACTFFRRYFLPTIAFRFVRNA